MCLFTPLRWPPISASVERFKSDSISCWYFAQISNSATESGWHMIEPFASIRRRPIWPCSSSILISTLRVPLLVGVANLLRNRLGLLELAIHKFSASRGKGRRSAPYSQCRFSHCRSNSSGSHRGTPKRRSQSPASPRSSGKSRRTWVGSFIFCYPLFFGFCAS